MGISEKPWLYVTCRGVIMDGGTGRLFPLAWTGAERLSIMHSISSRWDRNRHNGVASTRELDAVLFALSALATWDAALLNGEGIQHLIRLLVE